MFWGLWIPVRSPAGVGISALAGVNVERPGVPALLGLRRCGSDLSWGSFRWSVHTQPLRVRASPRPVPAGPAPLPLVPRVRRMVSFAPGRPTGWLGQSCGNWPLPSRPASSACFYSLLRTRRSLFSEFCPEVRVVLFRTLSLPGV